MQHEQQNSTSTTNNSPQPEQVIELELDKDEDYNSNDDSANVSQVTSIFSSDDEEPLANIVPLSNYRRTIPGNLDHNSTSEDGTSDSSSDNEENQPLARLLQEQMRDDLDDEEDNDNQHGPPTNQQFAPPNWSLQLLPIDFPVFTGLEGAILPAHFNTISSSPLHYFELLFCQQIWNLLLQNTNKYAQFLIEKKKQKTPGYTDKEWISPLTITELKAYVGVNIIMGLQPSKTLSQMWSVDPFLSNEGIKSVMSFRRFKKITEYLHVSDPHTEPPTTLPNYDRLAKVRPAVEMFLRNFQSHYRNSQYQAIDEAMIKFKGTYFIIHSLN